MANKELLNFIKESPTMFHTVQAISKRLDKEGFIYLPETENWELEKGKDYYTKRNQSSLIAFRVGSDMEKLHFQCSATHTDSPTFKIKHQAELDKEYYSCLNVEAYGSAIETSWFDRPLGVAGRVMVKKENSIESKLMHIEKDILLIPSVAIHLSRDIDKQPLNKQVDLCPLFYTNKKDSFNQMIADHLQVQVDQIIAKDLYLVNHQEPTIWGINNEFISSPKLDDLQGVYACLQGFIEGKSDKHINVLACFDNEEVGSMSKQGAMSTFFSSTLERLTTSLSYSKQDLLQALASSFLISCDNAHAIHPNHPELSDPKNFVQLNKGIVIKEAASQKYTTDAYSRAVVQMLCKKHNLSYQCYANRSDKSGGSTLGNLLNTQVSMHAVDIGLAQLAMHSSYETAGSKDTQMMIDLLRIFYQTDIQCQDRHIQIIEECV